MCLASPGSIIPETEKQSEVDRVRASRALQNAPMLQKLLDFLAHRAAIGDDSEINEYTVASEVFGRSGEFDPTGDTTVRTAVYRLRAKLRDYYANEGKLDPVVIELPKGKYSIQFARRLADGIAERTENGTAADAPLASFGLTRLGWFGLCAGGVILFAAGALAGNAWRRSQSQTPAETVTAFWRDFAGPEKLVLVTFANVEMLHTDSGDLLKFEGGAIGDRGAKVERSVAEKSVATPELLGKHTFFYEDGYSGTGEVQAVFSLARVLAQSGIEMRVKRSRLITDDDLKNHNVVQLGGGRENLAMDNVQLKQAFKLDSPKFAMWSNRIVDSRAENAGKNYAIERDPSTGALKVDYALFSVFPGVAPGHKIMQLAGLTTSGTQAAAEFATSESQIQALIGGLGKRSARTGLSFFESVLEVHVVKGLDPIEVRCVAARPVEP